MSVPVHSIVKKKFTLISLKLTIISEIIIFFSVYVEINTAYLKIFEKIFIKQRNTSANTTI